MITIEELTDLVANAVPKGYRKHNITGVEKLLMIESVIDMIINIDVYDERTMGRFSRAMRVDNALFHILFAVVLTFVTLYPELRELAEAHPLRENVKTL